MELTGLKKIYTSKGLIKENEPSIIEKLYNFAFGSVVPEKYVYGEDIVYPKDTVVFVLNEETNEIIYYKATKDTKEQITNDTKDWKLVSAATGDIGDAIIVADSQPTSSDNKVWYDTIAEVDINIPTDL